MDYFSICYLLVCAFGIILIGSNIEVMSRRPVNLSMRSWARIHQPFLRIFLVLIYKVFEIAQESDIEWLEKILSAPRMKSNVVARQDASRERHQYMFGETEVLLNRFADTLRSKYKRSGWFTDDPGMRATDTTSTRAPTFPPTSAPTTTTTTTQPPTTTLITTTRRTIKFPSFPKFPPSWPWGKRRKRRSAFLEKNPKIRYVEDTA